MRKSQQETDEETGGRKERRKRERKKEKKKPRLGKPRRCGKRAGGLKFEAVTDASALD